MTIVKHNMRILAMGIVASAILAGCGGSEQVADTPPNTTTPAAGTTPAPVAGSSAGVSIAALGIGTLPGMPAAPITEPDKVFQVEGRMVASRYGRPRNDPFSLKPRERSFEIEQSSARLLNEMGGMTVMYTPAPEKAPDAGLVHDPQPYRRLSGIIVGDSVYALMDTGGQIEIIRPGMMVPNTEWEVVSIDEEKAILRRKGNKLPRQITVRLESPPPGSGGGSNGPGAGSGSAPGPGSGPAGLSGAGGGTGGRPG